MNITAEKGKRKDFDEFTKNSLWDSLNLPPKERYYTYE